ncbi:MAG: beta-ketothiolase BktB [Hyphomicrobiaceae bacterium]
MNATNDRNIVILSCARTPIGSFGGALKGHSPCELASLCAKEAISRSKFPADRIGHTVFGNVIHTEPRDMYLSRVAMIEAGVPQQVPALTVNRLCGSGLQAIINAAQAIALGEAEAGLAGGAESMSNGLHASRTPRWGAKMGDVAFTDMMVGALTDPFGNGHMGITAENIAERYNVSRAEQDAFAAESHRRATSAQSNGYFDEQIVPVEVKVKRTMQTFSKDEGARSDVDAGSLGKLRPVFQKSGSVTAGNASSINDGAAAVVIASQECADAEGAKPLARILGWAHAGLDPSEMGMGPIYAVRKLMDRTGLKVEDFDVIESNEAFAAQACAVANELKFPAEKTNPNGGAIALGHPIGATGAIITIKALHELRRTGGDLGLITMCIGGGQGIAMAIQSC